MILTAYSIICDGCGLGITNCGTSRANATSAAIAEGWSYGGRSLALADQHWCPGCTRARKESGRGE